jgi:hypothetical protein
MIVIFALQIISCKIFMTQVQVDAFHLAAIQLEKAGLDNLISNMASVSVNDSTASSSTKRQYDQPSVDLQNDHMLVAISPTLLARVTYYSSRPSIDIGRYNPELTDEDLAEQQRTGKPVAAKSAKRKFGTPISPDEFEALISTTVVEEIRERVRVARTVGEKKGDSKREEMQRIMRENEKARQEKFLFEKKKAEALAAAEQECECPPSKRLTIEEGRPYRPHPQAAERFMAKQQQEEEEREAKLRALPVGRQPMSNGFADPYGTR